MIGRHDNHGSRRLRAVPAILQSRPEQSRNISPSFAVAAIAHLALVVGLAAWKLPAVLRAAAMPEQTLTTTITFAGLRETDNAGGTGGGNPNAGGRGDDTPTRLTLGPRPTPKLEMPPLPQPQLPRVIAVETPDTTRLADYYQPRSPLAFAPTDASDNHGSGNGTGKGVGDGSADGVTGNGVGVGTGDGDGTGIGFGGANYLRSPQPRYPALAREKGWEGTTVLRVEIQSDGMIGAIQITQSAGHKVLDDAAIESVRAAQFQPARHNGAPITSWVEVPVTFRLHRG